MSETVSFVNICLSKSEIQKTALDLVKCEPRYGLKTRTAPGKGRHILVKTPKRTQNSDH